MTTFSLRADELRWSTISRLPHGQQPILPLRRWLLDKGSLTAKLVQHSQHNFSVQILRQHQARASLSETRALGIAPHSIALIREVVLRGYNQPWVFARSVLPLSSLTGRLRHLRKQGNQPLGAFLFSQPQLQRSPIAVAAISRHHAYLPPDLIGKNSLWGRRSIFYVDRKPMLVSEVFLDGFPANPGR